MKNADAIEKKTILVKVFLYYRLKAIRIRLLKYKSLIASSLNTHITSLLYSMMNMLGLVFWSS